MSESSMMQEGLAALERFFAGDATMSTTLTAITELVTIAVPQAEFAGITMTVDSTPGTWIFTHPTVSRLDRVQYDTGDGPCLDAVRSGDVQVIESTSDHGPWPRFRQTCLDHGILSTISVPLLIDHRAIGAMNLYARSTNAFGHRDIRIAALFAAQAALVLCNAQAYWDAGVLDEDVGELTTSRAIIEQAKGVIMASSGGDAGSAHDRLMERARRYGITARAMAARLVEQAREGSI